MFSLIYGWRQWRGQRLQWLFIALGLSLLSAMLLLLSQLYRQLVEPSPAWLGASGPFVTVQRQDPRGQFQYISNAELNKLSQLPEVLDAGRIKFGRLPSVRIAEQRHEDLRVAYYSDNLPQLLQLPAPFSYLPQQKPGVYLSHWLWQVLDKPALDGLMLVVNQASGWQYPVLGVLPKELNRFTSQRPALWLPMTESRRRTTEQRGENFADKPSEKTIAFNENFPDYLAIAKLAGNTDLIALAQRFDAIETQWLGYGYHLDEEPHQAVLLPGVELFPQQRAMLLNTWWLLCCLSLMLASVVALNLMVSLLGQLIRRSHEFGVRRMFGAGFGPLCQQCLMEQLPLCLFALLGGLCGYALFIKLLSSTQLFGYYFGPAGLPFELWTWLGTVVVICGFILLCSLLPLWLLVGKTRFYRNRQAQSHRWQLLLLRFQLLLQASVAGFVLLLAASLQLLLWQQQQEMAQYPYREIEATLKPGYTPDARLQQGQLGGLGPMQLALSASAFDESFSGAGLLALDGSDTTYQVFTMMVSEHYLTFVKAKVLAGSLVLAPNQLVLSQSVADKLLQPGQSYADLIGGDVAWQEPMARNSRISGIVAELPHSGVGQQQQPMMYQLWKPNAFFKYAKLSVLTAPGLEDAVLDALDEWADQQSLDVELLPKGLLSEQLRAKNESQWLLTQLSLWMALLICVLTCVSLYYQVNAQLALQQQRLGTMLALGAQRSSLIGRLCGLHLLLLVAAMPLVAGLLYGLSPWLASKMGSTVFLPQVVPMVVALLLLMVLLASWLPAQWRLRRPISELLQAR